MLRAIIDMDHLPYLGFFLAGIVVALALGAYLSSRSRSRLPLERLTLVLCPPVVVITFALASIRVVQTPDNDWNAARLAPAVALLSGAELYVGPGGPGAVMNTIEPPLAYLAYLPAGLFSRATRAIIAGSCISLALYLAPAFVLSFWRRKEDAGGRSLLMSVACLLVFVQASLTSKSLNVAAFFIHADAPMLAFAGFASLALYLGRRDAKLSPWTCLVSSSCASMAIGSELSAAPAVLVLPLWVLATRGLREAVRYMLWLVVAMASFTLLFGAMFGVESFRFNVIDLAIKRPWIYPHSMLTDGLLMVSSEFFCASIAPVATLILAMLARWCFTRAEARNPGGEEGGIRRWLVDNPWLLFVLMAIASVPTSFLFRLKVGGYLNNYAPSLYFLEMGLISLLLEWHAINRSRGREPFNALLQLSLILLVLSPMTWSEDNFQVLGVVHRPSRNPQEVAYRYSKRHPGSAYFPWNPLSSLLGERNLYHFEYGLVDRESSGYPVAESHFRRNLPEGLRYVCFPPHYRGLGDQFEKTMRYLPEFSRRVEVEELPGWTCYERTLLSEKVK